MRQVAHAATTTNVVVASMPSSRSLVSAVTLSSLPDEILINIFSLLPLREKNALKYVCKRWKTLAVSALRAQRVIGIGSLSPYHFENIRFRSCCLHGWDLKSVDTIPAKRAKALIKMLKQKDGSVTCLLYRMFPNLQSLLIGSDISLPNTLFQLWSGTLSCLCVHSHKDNFKWRKDFRLICYRGNHVTESLVRSCPQLQYIYCNNVVPPHVVNAFHPNLKFLTCDLSHLTDLSSSPVASTLRSLNVSVLNAVQTGHADSSIAFPSADYIRIQIPYSKAFAEKVWTKKQLVKLILDFDGGENIVPADLMDLLHRVQVMRQLSLQLLPGPNPNVVSGITVLIARMYPNLEELRLELPGAAFKDSTLNHLSCLSNLTTLMIRDGAFTAKRIISFLTHSSSRSILQRLILVTTKTMASQSSDLKERIASMKANMSLRDVAIS